MAYISLAFALSNSFTRYSRHSPGRSNIYNHLINQNWSKLIPLMIFRQRYNQYPRTVTRFSHKTISRVIHFYSQIKPLLESLQQLQKSPAGISKLVSDTSKIELAPLTPEQIDSLAKSLHRTINSIQLHDTVIAKGVLDYMHRLKYIFSPSKDRTFWTNLQRILNSVTKKDHLQLYPYLPPQLCSTYFNPDDIAQLFSHVKRDHRTVYRILKQACINSQLTRAHINFLKSNMPTHKPVQQLLQLHTAQRIPLLPYPSPLSITNTEMKIIDLLEHSLKYNVRRNMSLSHFQLDCVIGDSVIVEYNGYHHYAINSESTLLPFEAYKYGRFESLGYKVVAINSREWEKIANKDQQAKFLINSIQSKLVGCI